VGEKMFGVVKKTNKFFDDLNIEIKNGTGIFSSNYSTNIAIFPLKPRPQSGTFH
jgi:hypothetical protein